MTTWLVSTLSRYVLVDAVDEAEARVLGRTALHNLYADLRERLGREVPINILIVRPATADEIAMVRFHEALLQCEKRNRRQQSV